MFISDRLSGFMRFTQLSAKECARLLFAYTQCHVFIPSLHRIFYLRDLTESGTEFRAGVSDAAGRQGSISPLFGTDVCVL